MTDPTYNREEIDANPVWRAAFILSEFYNDNAPIGWSRYIRGAEAVLAATVKPPKPSPCKRRLPKTTKAALIVKRFSWKPGRR